MSNMAKSRPRKGSALERAVRLIQEAILESDPKLRGSRFTIEKNKIVEVAGVHHEIDVYVKTLPDSAFESVLIFECKDWKKPVNKNEVMILAGKVDAIRANCGFLVARRLTKDAAAQVKSNQRIRFIQCSHEIRGAFDGLDVLDSVHNTDHASIGLKHRGVPPVELPPKIEIAAVKCRLNGQAVDIQAYANQCIHQIVAADYKANSAKYLNEGTHPSAGDIRIDFTPGQFTVNDEDIEWMTVEVRFTVTIRKRKIVSKFELEGHGAVFSYAEEEDGTFGKLPQIDIITRC